MLRGKNSLKKRGSTSLKTKRTLKNKKRVGGSNDTADYIKNFDVALVYFRRFPEILGLLEREAEGKMGLVMKKKVANSLDTYFRYLIRIERDVNEVINSVMDLNFDEFEFSPSDDQDLNEGMTPDSYNNFMSKIKEIMGLEVEITVMRYIKHDSLVEKTGFYDCLHQIISHIKAKDNMGEGKRMQLKMANYLDWVIRRNKWTAENYYLFKEEVKKRIDIRTKSGKLVDEDSDEWRSFLDDMSTLHTYISDKNDFESNGTHERPEELKYKNNYPGAADSDPADSYPANAPAAGGNLSRKKRRSSKKSQQSKRKNKKL